MRFNRQTWRQRTVSRWWYCGHCTFAADARQPFTERRMRQHAKVWHPEAFELARIHEAMSRD